MPTKKIGNAPGTGPSGRPCLSPDHNPPNMMVFQPGIYEHTCSGCGAKQTFTVAGVYC